MKMTWKKKQRISKINKRPVSQYPDLPFDKDDNFNDRNNTTATTSTSIINPVQKEDVQQNPTSVSDKIDLNDDTKLAMAFEEQGNKLAEDGDFREALGKWEAALNLKPERAVLHEQKAQVLLELGESWKSVNAATRATELEPNWAEAWITLGRSQLNFGEPDSAIISFDRALAIKPDSVEGREDRQMASLLVKRRKQLHLTGLSSSQNRFFVQDKDQRC